MLASSFSCDWRQRLKQPSPNGFQMQSARFLLQNKKSESLLWWTLHFCIICSLWPVCLRIRIKIAINMDINSTLYTYKGHRVQSSRHFTPSSSVIHFGVVFFFFFVRCVASSLSLSLLRWSLLLNSSAMTSIPKKCT